MTDMAFKPIKNYSATWGYLGLHFNFSTTSRARAIAMNVFGATFMAGIIFVAMNFSYMAWNGFLGMVSPGRHLSKLGCVIIMWVSDLLIPKFFWVIMIMMFMASMING